MQGGGGCAGRATGACHVRCLAEASRVQSTVKMKPARSPLHRHPITSRGQVPGGGPQSAVDGADEADELPARHPYTTSRGQVQGGGPQSHPQRRLSLSHRSLNVGFEQPSPDDPSVRQALCLAMSYGHC